MILELVGQANETENAMDSVNLKMNNRNRLSNRLDEMKVDDGIGVKEKVTSNKLIGSGGSLKYHRVYV